MTTITVSQGIEAQRGTAAPYFEALREDMTAHFWEGFGEAAAKYRRARNEDTGAREFAFTVSGLIADARGTANNPEYGRGVFVPDEWPVARGMVLRQERERLEMTLPHLADEELRDEYRGVFESAADMFSNGSSTEIEFRCDVDEILREILTVAKEHKPVHGERDRFGRMGRAERVVVFVTGLVSAIVLVWIGFLVAGGGPFTPVTVPAATMADAREADADLITRGAYWSWEVAESCGTRGPQVCERTLSQVNAQAAPYGLHVWEDGSVSPYPNR